MKSLDLDLTSDEKMDNFFDFTGKKYSSVVYELALSDGDELHVMNKTGISQEDLDKLKVNERFIKDLEKVKTDISKDGTPFEMISKVFSQNALYALNEIILDQTNKSSDRLKAMELMMTAAGVIKGKDQEVAPQQVVIKFSDAK